MNYRIIKPSLPLASFVKHYWTIENCYYNKQIHTQRIVPNGLADLTFYLGERPFSDNSATPAGERALLTGQLSNYYDIQVSGSLSIFAIQFQPHGLAMFLDIPQRELQNQNVPLKFLLNADAAELETRLYEAASFEKRIQIIEGYLLKLIGRKAMLENLRRIQHCINYVNRARGVISIDYLAAQSCLSRKQFERIFSVCIGTSPKKFLKIIRFQNVLYEKSKDKTLSFTELSYKCGYYDQSHMIADFRKFTGLSPSQYFKDAEAFSDYFL